MQAARHSQSAKNTVFIFGNRASPSKKRRTFSSLSPVKIKKRISSNGFREVWIDVGSRAE
jgi:hypothetical protein